MGLLASSAAGAILALSTLAAPTAAMADNECGAPPPGGGTVTCTSAGNPYPNGVYYIAPPADLTVALDSDVVIDTSGTLNPGILILGVGNTAMTVDGRNGASITTDSDGGFGILGATNDGALTLGIGSVSTSGANATGVFASSATGATTVDAGTVNTSGDNAHGIAAYTNSGDINVSGFTVVTQGANAFGVLASSDSGGDVSVTGSTFITNGTGSTGISATASSGNVSVTPSAVLTYGDNAVGVRATSGSGAVTVDLFQAQTQGANSDAIVATSTSGAVDVTATAATTNGDGARAIVATGGTTASVTSSGFFVATGGDNASAIVVRSGTGLASVNAGTAFTNGANSRVVDIASVSGDVLVNTGGITSQGDNANGIFARGVGAVDITAGLVSTYGETATAIDARSTAGPVTVTTTEVNAAGTSSRAIDAQATTGAVSVINNGAVRTTGDTAEAVFVQTTTGEINVAGSGNFTTAGAGSAAIVATSDTGRIILRPATVITQGANANGVTANTAGFISLVTGDVRTNGTGSTGVEATSTGDAIALNVIGAGITSAQGVAVDLDGVSVGINTQAGSVISGLTGGIVTNSTAGSGLTLRGTVSSANGFAINATGAQARIDNLSTGVINGRISLTGGADVVNNAGAFNASGNSDFGAGADVFNNSGTLRVLAGSVPVGNVTFANLESLNNTGLVTLQNNRAGDSLTLPGVFNGGTGSQLALDVAIGATSTADKLIVGTATGSTSVSINNTGAGLLTSGVLIVDASAASTATAFTLAPGQVNSGLVRYQVVYDPTAFNYLLVGTPQAAAYESVIAGEAATNMWRKTGDVWSGHITSLRDASWAGDTEALAEGVHVWGQFYGGQDSRDAQRSFTDFGVTTNVDLSYDQQYMGLQGGVDFIRPMGGGAAVFGLTGGYGATYLDFDATGDGIDLTGGNVGAYAAYISGPFFVNGLVKVDFLDGRSSMTSVAARAEYDGRTYGAQLETGYRFGSDRFFVEPVVSLAYVRADLDSFSVLQSTVDFNDFDSLRGKAGVRVGGAMQTGMGKLVPYAGLYVVEEFKGDDGVVFSNNGFNLPFENEAPGTFGQAQIGLNFAPVMGFTGFVEANANFGGDAGGGGGRLGFRIKW